MAHDPRSRILEEYYDDVSVQVDVSTIALSESPVDLIEQSRAILYKFTYTLSTTETTQIGRRAIDDDKDYQKATTPERKRCFKICDTVSEQPYGTTAEKNLKRILRPKSFSNVWLSLRLPGGFSWNFKRRFVRRR
jgi:hypothetical protein